MTSLGLAQIGIDASQDKGPDHVPTHPGVWADEFTQVRAPVLGHHLQQDLCFVYRLSFNLRMQLSHYSLGPVVNLSANKIDMWQYCRQMRSEEDGQTSFHSSLRTSGLVSLSALRQEQPHPSAARTHRQMQPLGGIPKPWLTC